MPNPRQTRVGIAILGWGSLLWENTTDKAEEFNQHHGGWNPDNDSGPSLTLEFSRISASRSNALTLVLDYENGEPCRVAYAFSKRKRPEDAVCDLRCREGTVLRKIGCYYVNNPARTLWVGAHPDAQAAIAEWAGGRGIGVVVWTGLESRFKKEKFSVEAAKRHIQELDVTGQKRAAEYICRAPDFINTPLRRGLQSESWFKDLRTTW